MSEYLLVVPGDEFKLSTNELIFLVSIFDPDGLPGIEDTGNLTRMDEAQLAQEWDLVQQSLAEKHYILKEDDDFRIGIDENLLKMVLTCVEAHQVLVLQISDKGQMTGQINFYISEDNLISITVDPEDHSQLVLKNLAGILDLLEILDEMVLSQGSNDGDLDLKPVEISLSMNQYYSFMSAVQMKNAQKAVEILAVAGVDAQYAEDAAGGFIGKSRCLTLTNMTPQEGDWKTEVLMLFKGANSEWMLSVGQDDSQIITFTRVTIEQFDQAIKKTIIFGGGDEPNNKSQAQPDEE